ncbi:beta-taxilin-like isoform X1 [Amphiura filiformis]|uniref:beta-taxilin-like isoform X1 n=1 Tax=Amphiura filiformis TaxID=82378 RepID=UPI003B2176E6
METMSATLNEFLKREMDSPLQENQEEEQGSSANTSGLLEFTQDLNVDLDKPTEPTPSPTKEPPSTEDTTNQNPMEEDTIPTKGETTPEDESDPGPVNGMMEGDEKEGDTDTPADSEKSQEEQPPREEAEGKADEVKKSVKEGKSRRKKGKDAEHMSRAILQALNGLETPEEKIAALCKKYAELLGETKAQQREVKVQQKQLTQLQRERDHLQSEHGRALLAKSKLESLCRELQRHNKTIKDESLQRAREEEEKRKEVSAKFQQTINEITAQMQENHTRNLKLKEENLELASKLKNLVEQYERREEHIDKLFKHKELESQLYDAKLQQSNLALAEEKERNLREKAILLSEAADAQRKCELLSKQEAQLKAQLSVYTEKFEEFQNTLTKSNEVFQTFKQEMDKMTKKIKKLEKETNMWRVRWENSNKSLLQMAEEKTVRDKDLGDQRTKIMRLEKLCRALQAERNALLGKARAEEGAETPPEASTPPPSTASTPPPADPPLPGLDTADSQSETSTRECNQSDPEVTGEEESSKDSKPEEESIDGKEGSQSNESLDKQEGESSQSETPVEPEEASDSNPMEDVDN